MSIIYYQENLNGRKVTQDFLIPVRKLKKFNYIKNQELHHKKQTFKEEYITFLTKSEIEFEEQYLFEFFD
jgi:hypothetical protein